MMQLKDYLELEGQTSSEFAAKIEVTKYAVRKWLRGERTPRPSTMIKIKKVTKGAVTAEDWLRYHH